MNVLIVSSSFLPKMNGAIRCVYDHARKLAERGHNVYLITRKLNGTPAYENIEGINVIRASPSYRRTSFWNRIGLFFSQMALIIVLHRKIRFDVIHCHGTEPALSALPAKHLFKVPLILTTHSTPFLWPSWTWWKGSLEFKVSWLIAKFVIRDVDCIIAQSDGVKGYMLDLHERSLAKKIRIIPTGVDESKFCKSDRQRSEKPIVLFVGGLSKVKGLDTLIKAASNVLRVVPETLFLIAGEGPQKQKLEKLTKQLGISDSVIFKGSVTDDETLVHLYDMSTIVVLPSNVGGPVACTILEGMSVGKPVISTNVKGGIPDVIKNGETGILVRPGNVEELSNAIIKLLTNPKLTRRMGESGRRRVEAKYSLTYMAELLESLYEELAYPNRKVSDARRNKNEEDI
jgi:glycosyltransferase involved in cell wall biosynthesis